jgi:hypothetical protein
MKYLTPDDFKIAAENGISEDLAKRRFYGMKWEKERAITQMPRNQLWNQYKDVCERNGIDRRRFYKRMYYNNMEPEIAASRPKGRKRSDKFTDEMLETARKNGIGKATLFSRVCTYKWTPDDAVNTPVGQKRGERIETVHHKRGYDANSIKTKKETVFVQPSM